MKASGPFPLFLPPAGMRFKAKSPPCTAGLCAHCSSTLQGLGRMGEQQAGRGFALPCQGGICKTSQRCTAFFLSFFLFFYFFFQLSLLAGIWSSACFIFLIFSWLPRSRSYSQAFLWFSHKVPSVDTYTPVLHLLQSEKGRQKVPNGTQSERLINENCKQKEIKI